MNEALGILRVRAFHRAMALRQHRRRVAAVHHGRGAVGNPGMAVLRVVVGEEVCAPLLRVREVGEAVGIAGAILGRLEERLDMRVVVADAWPREGAHDAEVFVERMQVFRDLNAAAVTVRGELAGQNTVSAAGRRDEALGQRGRLAPREHPRDDVPTVQIQHDIQFVVLPFRWTAQLGDVPRPDLIRLCGREARYRVDRVPALRPALPHFVVRGEHAVHRAWTAEGAGCL